MKKSRKKKRKAFFKKGLLIYLCLLVVVILGIWIVLWSKLSSYQKNIDSELAITENETNAKRAAQIAFEKYANELTLESLSSAYKTSNEPNYDKDENINAFINEHFLSKELTYWKAANYTEAQPVYLIKNDSEELATITMAYDGTNWNASTPNILISGEYDAAVTVPEGSQVLFNNIAIDSSVAVESESLKLDDYQDSLTAPTKYLTYEIHGLLAEPEISVNYDSDKYNIVLNESGDYYLALKDAGNYPSEAEGFVKSLLYYYAQGKYSASANMASATSHVASGSTAASIIRQSLDGVLWRYPTNATYDTRCSDTYVLAENCYFTDIYYKEQNVENAEEQIYRVYFLDIGSGFKIYAFAML